MATKLPPSTALRAMRGGGRIPHTRSDLQLTVELCRATLGEEKGRGGREGGGGRWHWFRTRALVGRWHALGAEPFSLFLACGGPTVPVPAGPRGGVANSLLKEYGFIKVHHSNNRIPSLYPIRHRQATRTPNSTRDTHTSPAHLRFNLLYATPRQPPPSTVALQFYTLPPELYSRTEPAVG